MGHCGSATCNATVALGSTYLRCDCDCTDCGDIASADHNAAAFYGDTTYTAVHCENLSAGCSPSLCACPCAQCVGADEEKAAPGGRVDVTPAEEADDLARDFERLTGRKLY